MSDSKRLDYLQKLLMQCPHTEILFNDDPDQDEPPVGFTIRVEGCEKSETTAQTLRKCVDLDIRKASR